MKNNTGRETLDALLGVSLLFRKLISRPMEQSFSADLTVTQFHAMAALCFAGPMNMTQLAAQLYISKQQLTKIVDGLVEKGFARRFGDDRNRRVVLVSITDTGRQMMDRIQQLFIDSLLPSFDRLTDAQKRKLVNAAENIRQVLSDMDRPENT